MRWLPLCFLLLAGCHAPPPPPPTVADLQFPVVVLYGHGNVRTFPDADSLNTMSIGVLNSAVGPPALIDSQFKRYRLADLASTHNGLWLMMNPTGTTPVKFTLERAPESGIAVARALFLPFLEGQTWRQDLDEKRRALAAEQTLPGMFTIVHGEDR